LTSLNSSQDLYIVADYIDSRSMIDDLSKGIDLSAIYSKPRIEPEILAGRDPIVSLTQSG
jgi:capsule polysaccharide export protein KpsE/RkpR